MHAWLDERVASRLAVVGIRTLNDLVFWVRTKGFNWHCGLPKVGPEGAARIVRWLREHEAIQAWLRLRIEGSHTWHAYRKEAERFLLWAVMQRRKALSSLDGDDCVAYRDFLASPGIEWTGPRNAQRWSEAWRPFEGPLAVRSAATAITIVRTLCEWLVRRHYLDSNSWDDVPARPDAPTMPQLRPCRRNSGT